MARWIKPTPKDELAKKVENLKESDDVLCRTSSGVDLSLEEMANYLLATARRGTTRHSELRDYLSQSQLDLRASREIYPAQGFPESHLFSGLYRRVYNPNARGAHSSNSAPSLDGEDGS